MDRKLRKKYNRQSTLNLQENVLKLSKMALVYSDLLGKKTEICS